MSFRQYGDARPRGAGGTALVAQFRALLVRAYSSALSCYRDEDIEYKPLRFAPGETEVLVRSAVRGRGAEPLSIDYDMESTELGWKVYDVKIGGSAWPNVSLR